MAWSYPLILWICLVGQNGPLPKPTGEAIVAPDAKLELLYTRTAPIHGGLTEGPTAAPDGCIYFSDIPEGKDEGLIVKFDPKKKSTTYFTTNSRKSNGLKFDPQGSLIACEGSDHGGRCVAKWDILTGSRTVLAEKYQGKRFNAPNDLWIDAKGQVYFTDPRYLGDEPRELEFRAVYRINSDGTVLEITHEVEKPNGIALSPDGTKLYVADHNNGSDKIVPGEKPAAGAMKVYEFPLGKDGTVDGARKILWDFGKEPGCDGMTIDKEGNLYLTSRSPKRPGVLVLNPKGREIAFIPTGHPQENVAKPTGLPSNVTFGRGPENKTLYITVDLSLYRIPLKSEGLFGEIKK